MFTIIHNNQFSIFLRATRYCAVNDTAVAKESMNGKTASVNLESIVPNIKVIIKIENAHTINKEGAERLTGISFADLFFPDSQYIHP